MKIIPKDDEIAMLAVNASIKASRIHGFHVGELVCRTDNEFSHEVVEIVGNSLIVERPVSVNFQNGPKVRETWPAQGTFGYAEAAYGAKFASQIRDREIIKRS